MRTARLAALLAVLLDALLLSGCGAGSQGGAAEGPSGGVSSGDRQAANEPSGDPGRPDGERVSVPGGSFARLSPGTLEAMLGGGEEFALVNVHIPFEGKITGTDLFVPYDEIGRRKNLARLPNKDARVVLYCRSGSMSYQASRTLVGLGYGDVYDLEGGMEAWEGAGFPLQGT